MTVARSSRWGAQRKVIAAGSTAVVPRPPDPGSCARPGPLDTFGPRFPFLLCSVLSPPPLGAPLCLVLLFGPAAATQI